MKARHLVAILAAFVSILAAACSTGRGIGGSTPINLGPQQGDLNGDGDPDDKDNCPSLANPPTVVVGNAISCETVADCYLPGDMTMLVDGVTPVPTATSTTTGATAQVGLYCPMGECLVQADADWDGIGDACDADDDGDKIADNVDNCPLASNQDQLNTDSSSPAPDTMGNACDADDDNDGVSDEEDLCSLVMDPDQIDTDNDGEGDACDDDKDGDDVLDAADNCPLHVNPDQVNTDGDTYSSTDPMTGGDMCDVDDDGDMDPDATDCAPTDPNIWVGQIEACNGVDDDCSATTDEDFVNTDEDTWADCVDTDDDNDAIVDESDNCPLVANPDQVNTDADAYLSTDPMTGGDMCDTDDDGDLDLDTADNCPLVMNASQTDQDGDELGDACDEDCDGDNVPDTVSCNMGDLDGDGYEGEEDCLEGEGSVHPGAIEVCNNADDDCDGSVDEGGDELCLSWEVCMPSGCEQDPELPEPGCLTDDDCSDTDACTMGACGEDNFCVYSAITCDDDDACTTDSCDTETGCVYTPMDCADDQPCTDDVCQAGECVYTAKMCSDSDACTTDSCNTESGACVFTSVACPEGQTCNPSGVCEVPPECEVDEDCNDMNPCTQNNCVAGSCVHPAVSCAEGQACDTDDGICKPLPTVGMFSSVFTLDSALLPPGFNECRFLFEGRTSAGVEPALENWGIKATAAVVMGQPVVLTWSKTLVGLGWFKANVVCLNTANSAVQWYAARCESAESCIANGRLDFTFYDGMTLWDVIKVGTSSNNLGGLDFKSNFAADRDGDGRPNGSDSSPDDGSLPSAPPPT